MGYRILIVDDSEIIRSVVRKTVNMSGISIDEVCEAGNGAEALEVLAAEWIDLVFADINMPVMNGVELVQRMAESELLRGIPVVIVSSDHSKPRIEELRRLGIRGYLKKPFRPEEFRDVVVEVLGSATGGGQ